jgi:predicted nucleic acid-binding Zn ribbon protein
MGRRAPRPLSAALSQVQGSLEPPSLLAAIQANWRQVVGEAVAAVAEPVSEREGVVTVICADSVWAEELTLLAEDLTRKLREHLAGSPPVELRFRSR